MRSSLAAFLVLSLAAAPACSFQSWPGSSEPLGPFPDFRGTGVVRALLPPPSVLHASRPVIVIYHDPIPNLMNESMDMPFFATSLELLRGLEPGNRIRFGLKSTADALLVISVERVR